VGRQQVLPPRIGFLCLSQRLRGDLPGGILVTEGLQAADQRALDLRELVAKRRVQAGADAVHGQPGHARSASPATEFATSPAAARTAAARPVR